MAQRTSRAASNPVMARNVHTTNAMPKIPQTAHPPVTSFAHANATPTRPAMQSVMHDVRAMKRA